MLTSDNPLEEQFFSLFLDESAIPAIAGSFTLRSAAREKSKFVGDVDEDDDGSRGVGSSDLAKSQ